MTRSVLGDESLACVSCIVKAFISFLMKVIFKISSFLIRQQGKSIFTAALSALRMTISYFMSLTFLFILKLSLVSRASSTVMDVLHDTKTGSGLEGKQNLRVCF